MMQYAVSQSKELLEMKHFINKNGTKLTPSLGLGDIKAQMLKNGMYDKLKEVIRTMMLKESVVSSHKEMVPPDASILYKRVVGAHAYDIGSGDGAKVGRFVGSFGSVKLFEKDPGVTKKKVARLKNMQFCYEEFKDQYVPGVVLTSFNAFTQNITGFYLTEGIHLIVDVGARIKKGLGKVLSNGSVISCVGGKEYVDYVHEVPGLDFGDYKGINVYTEANITIKLSKEIFDLGHTYPGIGRHIAESMYVSGESHVKLDGELVRFKIFNGNVLAINRDGTYHKGKATGMVEGEMQIAVEVVPDKRLFLVEVTQYRGFKPFHSTEALEEFVRKKNIVICGVRLKVAPVFDPGVIDPYFEGIVWRVGGRDLLQRAVKSFDVNEENYLKIPEVLKNFALKCKLESWENRIGIYEVLLMHYESCVNVIVHKKRLKNTVDTPERMRIILSTPAMDKGTAYMEKRLKMNGVR